jgi:hypothetical protein
MATINRAHGQATAGSFFSGYQPLVIQIAETGKFTADTVVTNASGARAITDGGYANAIKAVQSLGSVLAVSSQTANNICFMVDEPTFNAGGGLTTSGAYGALHDALVAACGSGTYTVTTNSANRALTPTGGYTLA